MNATTATAATIAAATTTDSIESLAAARRALADQLRAWGLGALADDATLVLSELVTNVIIHGLGPAWHTLRRVVGVDGGEVVVRIEVGDHGPGRPAGIIRTPPPSPDECHGRGLHIVDAVARAWGSIPVPDGHLVWVEFATTA